MLNYFATTSVAERYARARPYFHPLVIQKIKAFLHLCEPLSLALDVACGTGMSTQAAHAISRFVVGADVSAAMLAHAPQAPPFAYCVAPAECLPLRDDSVDLLTVSSGFHWFERDQFLSEAQRVLHRQGYLVIYDNAFGGTMLENPAFRRWLDEVSLRRYPTPARDGRPVSAADALRAGFDWLGDERYENVVRFPREVLADYLTTQSNVTAVVEGGRERIEDVWRWFADELKAMYIARGQPIEMGSFVFKGPIWYLQRL